MPNVKTTLEEIDKEISDKRDVLDRIHDARMAVRGYTAAPSPAFNLQAAPPGHRTFKLLAHGDSWFDYPPGTDLIDCLNSNHGHNIVNIAVAGSTLNDEAYGPVPREMFGVPGIGPLQSDDPSRIAELVHRINEDKPDALLISAGGNDVAGDEFFSFINNADSGLSHVNQGVLKGVISETFQKAYEFMIQHALDAAAKAAPSMPIFLHGYDYPWPDGRGLLHFIGWRIGPWFDDTFNHKNYPNNNQADLQTRHDIVVYFIDALNAMQQVLELQFPGKVFHVDLKNTLTARDEWANELHPGNDGFARLAEKIDAALQAKIGR